MRIFAGWSVTGNSCVRNRATAEANEGDRHRRSCQQYITEHTQLPAHCNNIPFAETTACFSASCASKLSSFKMTVIYQRLTRTQLSWHHLQSLSTYLLIYVRKERLKASVQPHGTAVTHESFAPKSEMKKSEMLQMAVLRFSFYIKWWNTKLNEDIIQ